MSVNTVLHSAKDVWISKVYYVSKCKNGFYLEKKIFIGRFDYIFLFVTVFHLTDFHLSWEGLGT